jgi:hypothetical protein
MKKLALYAIWKVQSKPRPVDFIIVLPMDKTERRLHFEIGHKASVQNFVRFAILQIQQHPQKGTRGWIFSKLCLLDIALPD